MEIAIVGAGHVGLVAAVCFSEIGHSVVCVDNDHSKLSALRSGAVPFYEPHVEELLRRNVAAGRLSFSHEISSTRRAEAVFLCVGTPPLLDGDADLSAVEAVGRSLVGVFESYLLVVEKSTVPVLTGQRLVRAMRKERSDLELDVASNPEFLSEGRAVCDFLFPDRIVVGVESPRAAALMHEIYEPIVERRFDWAPGGFRSPYSTAAYLEVDRNTAEMIKYASNSFLSTKISYINMLSQICESVGADVRRVAIGMGLDRRIGPEFLEAGIGFGGFCFPKDLRSLIRFGERAGCDVGLLREVERINALQVARFVETVKRELWILKGKKIAAWGLSFKGGTDDIRFSPAISVIERLRAEDADVIAYDPRAMDEARAVVPDLRCTDTALEAVEGADCLLILTNWPVFASEDLDFVRTVMNRPLIIDGRNMLDPAEMASRSFEYHSIGRPPVVPEADPPHRRQWRPLAESPVLVEPRSQVNGGAALSPAVQSA